MSAPDSADLAHPLGFRDFAQGVFNDLPSPFGITSGREELTKQAHGIIRLPGLRDQRLIAGRRYPDAANTIMKMDAIASPGVSIAGQRLCRQKRSIHWVKGRLRIAGWAGECCHTQ